MGHNTGAGKVQSHQEPRVRWVTVSQGVNSLVRVKMGRVWTKIVLAKEFVVVKLTC